MTSSTLAQTKRRLHPGAMYRAGKAGQRRRSSACREHRRRREVGKVIKPGRVPKQLRVSRCKEEMAGLLEEKALQDEVFGVESELIDGSDMVPADTVMKSQP